MSRSATAPGFSMPGSAASKGTGVPGIPIAPLIPLLYI
jgi:hypothetical protein